MNRAQMRLEVRRALDELTANFWTENEINDWLNEGVKIMTSIAQPLQAIHQFTTALRAGSSTEYAQDYALPEDVEEIFGVTIVNGSNLMPLEQCDFRRIQTGTRVTGTPSHFYLRHLSTQKVDHTSSGLTISQVNTDDSTIARTVLGLYPQPSSAIQVNVCYFAKHFSLNSDADVPCIPAEFQRGIIQYAIYLGKEKDSAYAEADRALVKFSEFSEKLRDRMISRGDELAFPSVTVSDDFSPITGEFMVHYGSAS